MPPSTRYARVSDDEGEDVGMISEKRTSRLASPDPASRKTPWWKYAAGAVIFTALLIPAVGYTSSVLLDYRVAAAVQEALANQPAQNTTAAPIPVAKPEPDVKQAETTHNDAHDDSHDDAPDSGLITLSNGTTIEYGNPYGGKRYEIRHCGSNADEARALGCAYDVMMQEWTPPECIDWTLSEKFLKAGNWTWYADAGAEKIYNDTEIALGNHDVVYVDQSYHRHHCIFTWERLVRAMRTQRPLIEKLINYDHVMHCRMNTLKTFEEGAKPVRGVVAPTAFTKCASYDVWLESLPENKMSSVDRMLKLL